MVDTNEIMVNDVNEELDIAYEVDQEVESEGSIGNVIGVVAIGGMALYGACTLGKKAIAKAKTLLADVKASAAERKAKKDAEVEPDKVES